jgi:malonate decarboxylase alpha subunit
LEAADPTIRKAMRGVTPIMVYGDDVTHIVTEEGIANLVACKDDRERVAAIRGVAGYTPVGLKRSLRRTENLRDRGIIQRPEDLGVSAEDATRGLLAAANIQDLVRISGGLYEPPSKFVDW